MTTKTYEIQVLFPSDDSTRYLWRIICTYQSIGCSQEVLCDYGYEDSAETAFNVARKIMLSKYNK